jgi:AcrR family transcriptional regulator
MARASALQARKAPRQRRAAHTVDALLEAAAQVLEAQGLEGFNTNAVARRAGASIGSLYQYFPSKDALTLALLQREDSRFHDAARRALLQPTCQAALACLIDIAVDQQLTRPNLALLLDEQEGRPEFRAALRASLSFGMLIEEMLALPGGPAESSRQITAADLLAIIRGMTDSAGERGERDVAHLTRRVRAAVFGYLAASAEK